MISSQELEIFVKNYGRSKILPYLQASKLVYNRIMDVSRGLQTPGPESEGSLLLTAIPVA